VFENPNLIPRILRQEISLSPRPFFRSHSCPVVFQYLEDLPFDEHFDLSLFETKSKIAIGDTFLNPQFVQDLEIERANRSIDAYILNSLQTSIVATNSLELLESTSATLGSSVALSSSKVHSQTQFIPILPVQPSISEQRSAISSPPSTPQTSIISSPPSTPHTPITSTAVVVINPPSSPRPVSNPPRIMAARCAPLVLPQNLDAMPTDCQSKIPLFDATQGITAQQHVDRMNDFFDLHEIDEENVTMRLFLQSLEARFKSRSEHYPWGLSIYCRFFIDNFWIIGR